MQTVAASVAGAKQPSATGTLGSWLRHALNNSAPTFNPQTDQVFLGHDQSSGPIALGGEDVDGDVLSYTVSTGSAGGALQISGANFTYTPPADWDGIVS